MPDLLDYNLEIIRRRSPDVAQIAQNAPNLVVLEKARSGAWSGKIGSISLCGKYDPVREAQSFAKGQGVKAGNSLVLYGIGLGYHLKPLLDAVGPDGQVVAVEANGSILRAALTVIDDPAIIEDRRLTLVSGEDEIAFLSSWNKTFDNLDPAKTSFIIHIPSFQALPKQYKKVARAIELIRMERRFPLLMGGMENENFGRNLPVILKSAGISSLKGVINGESAVIVGAGPSLDRDIVYLDSCRHATILSSDTALPSLLKNGITPDLVFSIDPKIESLMHFELGGKFDIPTVFFPTSNAELVDKSSGEIFFGFKGVHRFPEPARAWANQMGEFYSGGSVSCIALETAFLMGAKTVLLFGQDFSFSNGRAYAQDTLFGAIGSQTPEEDGSIETENYFGQKIDTAINFFSYKREFESLVAKSPAKVITLAASGARLAGVTPAPAPWPFITQSCVKPGSIPDVKAEAGSSVEEAFLKWLSR